MRRDVRPFAAVLLIFAACLSLRLGEYFVLRTDQTFWTEAFVHKLAGIALLFSALHYFRLRTADIGWPRRGIARGMAMGAGFGAALYAAVYTLEMLWLAAQGEAPALEVYVSAYSVHGNIGRQTAWIFFLICALGNVINVTMEEGVFRGLFPRLLQARYRFLPAAVFSALLFGVWHAVAPLRAWSDGEMTAMAAALQALLLVFTTALIGFKFALLTRLTGNLYFAMGDHFANNFIINILHMTTRSGTDEWLGIRIAVAQGISFLLVSVCYAAVADRTETGRRLSWRE
ncbi:CPBP family intramembrane metalloprotease [Allofranklinella schreckenbergeri]|uniref:CPBP family intramembrane metalloprotease n=1 Tax=Allofranklinella schreckenbergeri TaxID=1076744 RepID=A0A3M6Q2G5_9BURK|nr:CPBP family intramembrane glutamic endopeptidase [Allofranklinella schreckenbergeri]RMW96964.1 CPBP family intramembrane metalloprotease [Allofranklinella schreckenbergeri]RRD37950.1 CPBP family intramembrane metalloprotease [Comamonadaceae bacterium OH3737_COT-264]